MNVKFLVGGPDGPDGPRGFFQFYREHWEEERLGPKPIVLGLERKVEIYRQPQSGRYQDVRIVESTEAIAGTSVPTVQISLPELFAGPGLGYNGAVAVSENGIAWPGSAL